MTKVLFLKFDVLYININFSFISSFVVLAFLQVKSFFLKMDMLWINRYYYYYYYELLLLLLLLLLLNSNSNSMLDVYDIIRGIT